MMTPKIVKSRTIRFSRAKLEAGTGELGLSIARDESRCCCCGFSRPSLGLLWRCFFYADHVRFHSCHPYIERLATDALIHIIMMIKGAIINGKGLLVLYI